MVTSSHQSQHPLSFPSLPVPVHPSPLPHRHEATPAVSFILLYCMFAKRVCSISAFLKRCKRYVAAVETTFPIYLKLSRTLMINCCISHNVTHVLKPLLPTNTQHSYNLRDRRHNFVLIERTHKSITGILSSDSCINIRTDCMCAVLLCLVLVAFCQLLLNEYCTL